MPPVDASMAVELRDLVKTYKGSGKRRPPKEALRGINLSIPRGKIFGLLGPNGAGKSTLINILAGLVIRTSGEARICGFDVGAEPRGARASIGVVPQELNLDAFFTPRELLDVQAGLYGVPKRLRRTEELLAAVNLTERGDAYARTLSGGMRRRLMVAKAMVHSPPVLVLDEPTAGVDIELRRGLWEHVRALNRQGTTVLLTTHYLEEAEELCDQIAIIHEGQLVANEPTPQLLKRIDSKRIVATVGADVTVLSERLKAAGWDLVGGRVIACTFRPSETEVGALLNSLQDEGHRLVDLTVEEAKLEDIFLQLTAERT